MKISLLTLLFYLANIHLACSKDLSLEEKNRERRHREELRLSGGASAFEGSAENEKGDVVPLSLSVEVITNPEKSGELPYLQAQLRIGFFNGVNLVSMPASYDWGSGELAANFRREGSNGQLELKLTIKNQKFVSGELNSAQAGKFVLLPGSPFALGQGYESLSQFAISTSSGVNAVLNLIPSSEKIEAPESASLPYLPALEASITFEGLGVLPHRAHRVIYDPLKGRIEIWTSETSRLLYENVFAKATGDTLLTFDTEHLLSSGRLIRGAQTLFNFNSQPNSKDASLAASEFYLPPQFYVGEFHGEGYSYPTISELQYLDQTGKHGSVNSFSDFPMFRMNTIVCLGGHPYSYISTEAISFNYFSQMASFESSSGVIFETDYGQEEPWNKLTIKVKNKGSNDTLSAASLTLRPSAVARTCADL